MKTARKQYGQKSPINRQKRCKNIFTGQLLGKEKARRLRRANAIDAQSRRIIHKLRNAATVALPSLYRRSVVTPCSISLCVEKLFLKIRFHVTRSPVPSPPKRMRLFRWDRFRLRMVWFKRRFGFCTGLPDSGSSIDGGPAFLLERQKYLLLAW